MSFSLLPLLSYFVQSEHNILVTGCIVAFCTIVIHIQKRAHFCDLFSQFSFFFLSLLPQKDTYTKKKRDGKSVESRKRKRKLLNISFCRKLRRAPFVSRDLKLVKKIPIFVLSVKTKDKRRKTFKLTITSCFLYFSFFIIMQTHNGSETEKSHADSAAVYNISTLDDNHN